MYVHAVCFGRMATFDFSHHLIPEHIMKNLMVMVPWTMVRQLLFSGGTVEIYYMFSSFFETDVVLLCSSTLTLLEY